MGGSGVVVRKVWGGVGCWRGRGVCSREEVEEVMVGWWEVGGRRGGELEVEV